MLLQTSIGQAVFNMLSPQTIITLCIEVGVIYIAYREFKTKIEIKTTDHDERLSKLEDEQTKIFSLQTDTKLMQKDLDFLKKDFEAQSKILSKLQEDIHKIKGSMISIEHYFKQIVDKE
jgi:peptidoglycan hydrolase CwlO-like protein